MATKIYKYPLDIKARQIIALHKDFCPLCVQLQNSDVCLWAEVDTETKEIQVAVEMYGTGQEIPSGDGVFRLYIGTIQQYGGTWVWHYYIVV